MILTQVCRIQWERIGINMLPERQEEAVERIPVLFLRLRSSCGIRR